MNLARIKKLAIGLFSSIPFLLSAQNVQKIHQKAILIDGHNDVIYSSIWNGKDISKPVPEGHTDFARWKKGGLDVQFFSVFTDPEPRSKLGLYADANDQIDSLDALIQRNPGTIVLARTYQDILKGIRQKKIVALIGVEGGHMIENDIHKLEALQKRGMRYLTLTWNNSTPWATSAMDETLHGDTLKHKGLTPFGREIVRKLNELGVLVDLAHVGEQTFYDAIAASTKPVIVSHSSVYNICPVFRNVKDEQIRAVAKNGGVICINFFSGFVSKKYAEKSEELMHYRKQFTDSVYAATHDSMETRKQWHTYYREQTELLRPTLSDVVDHIDYIVKLVGDDYVGIGSDFDGITSVPVGLEDVSCYPAITAELVKRGYSKKSIRKILGGNVLRVIKASF
ncbi:peptidase M19 [Niabella ginsenosidivorans]|uniref:Peptidase M19 n=1 Tax=Niabella ginsenosidivorans TaxID=1176587 RepID=A0A1A9HZG7_9BACT|nr:dipeptidase [Niabella ginsenosidivorans]ANH80209.1 peptidase M19 [Niabella ginsenosidivorans]